MWPERRRAGNGPPNPRPQAQAEGAIAPPRTLALEAEGARRRTKPRLHQRKRMPGGISRNLQAMPKGSFASRKACRPAKAAGIAPRLEPAGDGEGLRLQPRPETGSIEEASALDTGSGRAARPSGGAAIRKGKRRRDFGLAQATRRESPKGFTAFRRDPPGAERGFAASLRDPRRAKRALAPASQSKAAQREMASPPSDGSQSWDKWGPVATPAPIMIPAS